MCMLTWVHIRTYYEIVGEILKKAAIRHGVPASGVWGDVESSRRPCIAILRFCLLGMARAGFILFC